MRFRKLLLALMATLAVATPALAQKKLSMEERAKLPRIAILEFKAAPDAWHGWRFGGWGNQMGTISNQLRDLFTTEIMEKGRGKIRVIERERLSEIREELNFQQSGEADTATVQKIGKLLGVKYVMTGKVTRFAYKEGGFGTGAEVQYDEELVNKVFEPIVQRITPKLLRATVAANEDD